jgi:glycosyltransferase involved in cell wall biosynthesis
MADPMVSVVVPARNEERLLPAALRSIEAQTLDPALVEAVVVSNGSTDATVAVVEREAARIHTAGGPRVTVVDEAAPGIARAKNVGVRHARGRLLVFMDADSWMSPELLSRMHARAQGGERAASIRIIADGGDPVDRAFFWVIEHGKRLVRTRANMFWCERALFDALDGFDEALHHAEDLDLLVRAKRAGVQVGHIHDEWIATSARRLHRGPLRAGMFAMLGRWVLGHVGIGRHWPYSGGGP